jgi:twitching motility protein PilT
MPQTHNLEQILTKAKDLVASDVHITVGAPILFRIDGLLIPQSDVVVTAEQATQLTKSALGEVNWKRFEKERELDASYQLKDGTRLRVNCAFERNNPTLAARIIPTKIPDLETLGLENLAPLLCNHHEGLVLFTGATGSGKSTSLASLIHNIQTQRPINLITLEDPIEFLFPQVQGCVRQRAYGEDFHSFAEGLKHVLRQDPDVVMVGEMRDPETISSALTLAETGHLIFATLHTPNTTQTVDRIIDVFPAHQQPQVRSQLSMSLKAIVAQRLVPHSQGGRVALREVLFNTPAVSNIIRDNRPQELKSVLQTNEDIGMVSFEKNAKQMMDAQIITKEVYDVVLDTL